MKKNIKSIISLFVTISVTVLNVISSETIVNAKEASSENIGEPVVLRVCNWEEYIDEGDWGEEEAIDLDDDSVIIGENSMIEDFEKWYYETYGIEVNVEYSTFGTNEELYNQLNLGDVYDVVCPSEYMIMKLLVDDELEKFDESFFDESNEFNYYIKGVSPYIRKQFENNKIDGKPWCDYAAGYMWGITGIVYNPDEVTYEEASTWGILNNQKFNRKLTIKDNVRDAYFAAMGIYKADKLMDKSFINDDDYHRKLSDEMNDVSKNTIDDVEQILKDIKDNVYSFETDSGKSDMITGKVIANFQWSGDAVYALDQAEEDDFHLEFAVPRECTNLWFDGWTMLKRGIDGDAKKKHAAQAFINFLSRPDNAVRNMYYIGYTSVIAGGDDTTMFDYACWCYESEDDEEDTIDYDVSYFFGNDSDDTDNQYYVITAPADAINRQLAARYPSKEAIERSAIMWYFDDEASVDINQMWINVRCYDIEKIPKSIMLLIISAVAGIYLVLRRR